MARADSSHSRRRRVLVGRDIPRGFAGLERPTYSSEMEGGRPYGGRPAARPNPTPRDALPHAGGSHLLSKPLTSPTPHESPGSTILSTRRLTVMFAPHHRSAPPKVARCRPANTKAHDGIARRSYVQAPDQSHSGSTPQLTARRGDHPRALQLSGGGLEPWLRRRHDERAPRWISPATWPSRCKWLLSYWKHTRPVGGGAPAVAHPVSGALCRRDGLTPVPASRPGGALGGRRRPSDGL